MPSSDILAYACALLAAILWLDTYPGIIWRGFKDRSYGMPLVALGMNISWESVFSFIYPPLPAPAKYSVRAWFPLDIPIDMQWGFVLPLSWGSFP